MCSIGSQSSTQPDTRKGKTTGSWDVPLIWYRLQMALVHPQIAKITKGSLVHLGDLSSMYFSTCGVCLQSLLFPRYPKYWVHVVSCLGSPEVVSGRCAVGKCV